MNGKDLKVKLKHFNFSGNLNVEITNLKHDSRKIKAGDIFIALKSENGDGHRYIMDAIKRGARGIVVQENVDVPTDILKIKVPDTYSAYGEIANAIFDVPSKKISVVGTTGTMGKTTITYLYTVFLILQMFLLALLAPLVLVMETILIWLTYLLLRLHFHLSSTSI